MPTSPRRPFRADPGLLVALLLATLAAWPFLTRASLPTFTDAEMHVYRTYEILAGWQGGVSYLRWAPDLFYAFGYPVFNYYAPLSYYLGAAYGAIFGGSVAPAVAGVKFVLVASAYLGAVGMYLFVRDRWGGLAGVVSAAAFTFAPYLLYIDPHARGDSPETLAIALAPGVLWAFARLRRTASPGDIAIAAVSLAALVTAHNLMALVFFGLLLAWLAWDVVFGQMFFGAWVQRGQPSTAATRWPAVRALGRAVLLGLCLSAFMWLPAVLERDAVQFRNVAAGTYFDFRRYFIGVPELFGPTLIFDLGATQMRFNYGLGVAQWVLGLLGLLTVFRPRLRRLSVLFFAFAALALVYLMLPASIAVWETVSPMAFFQFPYRFLGPAAVVLGVLAGAALGWADYLPWKRARLAAAVVAVAGCLLAAMPQLSPPAWGDFGRADAGRILETELNGRGIGTTSANDFLPVGALVVPPPQMSLIDSYAAGLVDKVNHATLPAGTTVTVAEHGPQHDRFNVRGQNEFVLRLYTFWFPGWKAYVDGRPVPIVLSEPEGWITLTVPPGDHDVLVRLEDTWPRLLGWALAASAVIGLAVFVVWRLRLPVTPPARDELPWRPAALALTLVVLGGLGLRTVAVGLGWWQVHSYGRDVLVAQVQHYAPLQNNVALLAYDLPEPSARPGDEVPVTLYWKALAPVPVNLRVFVHLIGPDGQLWGQSDKWNPADFPTGRWPLDRYVRDEHEALLRPDAPPGRYQVWVGLWDPATNQRMPLLDEAGRPTGQDSILLTDAFEVSR
ncbi:MAG: hypothetical protein IT317_19220 [Anaerolineales bacterium]|nr:hypothetical protein [Anaerolineales bacterium]